jgi:hypothetical protein
MTFGLDLRALAPPVDTLTESITLNMTRRL